MKFVKISLLVFLGIVLTQCSAEKDTVVPAPTLSNFKYLALGDSYTIGESVCESCRFSAQLADSLQAQLNATIEVQIIAQTGWTTTNLKAAIADQQPATNFDLVTLLIGVNNQFQNRPFALYEQQLPELVDAAIAAGKGDKNNVIVVSIPDYAFTPFGQNSANPQNISAGIDAYNNFARNYCAQAGIRFVDITAITRQGIAEPALVASDGLHPSELAYTRFVNLLLPVAVGVLGD